MYYIDRNNLLTGLSVKYVGRRNCEKKTTCIVDVCVLTHSVTNISNENIKDVTSKYLSC